MGAGKVSIPEYLRIAREWPISNEINERYEISPASVTHNSFISSISYSYDQRSTCLDCRLTHPGTHACEGQPFVVGAVIIDTPAHWKRAIHCPVCCPEIHDESSPANM